MKPDEESWYWDSVARNSSTIEENVYGDLDLDDCLSAIQISIEGWVIELGCGVGRLTRPLALDHPKAHLVGVDSSPLMIDTASLLTSEVRWVLNNGRDLSGLSDDKFDAGYSMTTFQHIPPEGQQGYLSELHRVIKPGGKFRLQFVIYGETGPLSYPTSVKDVLGWADAAGWRETDVSLGRVKPEWAWVTFQNL